MGHKYSGFKKVILSIGIVMLIIGIILVIYGIMSFGGLFGASSGNINQFASTGFTSMAMMGGGGFLLVIGIGLVYFSQIRRVSSYVATETAPAVETTVHAMGKGAASGISEAGGLKVTSDSTDSKDIRIKCRHCGFLESIDAEYCSKCGKKV